MSDVLPRPEDHNNQDDQPASLEHEDMGNAELEQISGGGLALPDAGRTHSFTKDTDVCC
jgi:hypothetical protein